MARLFTSSFAARDATTATSNGVDGLALSNATISLSGGTSGGPNNAPYLAMTMGSGIVSAVQLAANAGVTFTTNQTYYFRFYVKVPAAPTNNFTLFKVSAGSGNLHVNLNTDLTLQLYTNNGTADNSVATSSAISTGVWQRVEIQIGCISTIVSWFGELRLNGATVGAFSAGTAYFGGTVLAIANPQLGAITSPNSSASYEIDLSSYAINNTAAGGSQTSWPGVGAVYLLLPTGDNGRGDTLWTAGSSGTTNLWAAVDNTPPVGVASASMTTSSQIKHAGGAASTTISWYKANMTTYTAAGLAATDKVRIVQCVGADGEEVATGTKNLQYSVISNPTIATSGSVTAGGDVGAEGTYPTNWTTHRGTISYDPSVTQGTAPVMQVLRPETTTRAADVCFMGMIVEATPATTLDVAGDGTIVVLTTTTKTLDCTASAIVFVGSETCQLTANAVVFVSSETTQTAADAVLLQQSKTLEVTSDGYLVRTNLTVEASADGFVYQQYDVRTARHTVITEGFEAGVIPYTASSGFTIQSTTVHGGSYALKLVASSAVAATYQMANNYVSSSLSIAFFRTYLFFDSLPSSARPIIGTSSVLSSSAQSYILLNPDGSLSLANGSTLTVVGTSTTALATGSWYRVEWMLNPTAGKQSLRIEGNPEVTNVVTTCTSFAAPAIGAIGTGSGAFTCYWDDLALDALNWPGAGKIVGLRPTSAGSATLATATVTGAATKWQALAETPVDDATSYVTIPTGTASTDNETYLFSGLPNTATAITAAALSYRYRATTSGQTGGFKTVHAWRGQLDRANSWQSISSASAPSTNWAWLIVNIGSKLAPIGPLTLGELPSFEFGFGPNATTGTTDLSAIVLQVEYSESTPAAPQAGRVLAESFESSPTDLWTVGSKASFTTSYARSGTKSLRTTALNATDAGVANAQTQIAVPSSNICGATLYARVYVQMLQLPASGTTVRLLNVGGTGTSGVMVVINSSGQLRLSDKTGLLGSSWTSQTISVGTWRRLELRLRASTTSTAADGEGELRLDGTSLQSVTNITVNNTPGTGLATLTVGSTTSSGAGAFDAVFDDVAMDTSFWVGESIVTDLLPTGTGTLTGSSWSVTGAASLWQALIDTPPDDATSYITSPAAASSVSFTLTQLPSSAGWIRYVNTEARASAASSSSYNSGLITPSSSTLIGVDASIHTAPTSYSTIVTLPTAIAATNTFAPASAADGIWTPALINQAQSILKVSSAVATNFTSVRIPVEYLTGTTMYREVSTDALISNVSVTTKTLDCTADAIIFAGSETSSLTGSAILQQQGKTLDETATGILQQQSKTTDELATAIIFVSSETSQSTASAIVQATNTKESTGSAVVFVSSETSQASASAIIFVASETSQTTASAITLATQTKELTSDALVAVTKTLSLTNDADLKVSGETSDLLTSSLVAQTRTTQGTADGDVFVAGQTASTNADALVQRSTTLESTASGILQQTNLQQTLATGAIQTTNQTQSTADTIVQATKTLEATADAVLVATKSLDLTVSADLLATKTADLGGSADLVATETSDLSASALAALTKTTSITGDGPIQTTNYVQSDATAIVQSTKTIDLVTSAILLGANQSESTGSAVMLATNQTQSSGDALLQITKTLETSATGPVQTTLTLTASADALLQISHTLETAADAITQAVGACESTATGAIQTTLNAELLGSADLVATELNESTGDALLAAPVTRTFTADGLLAAPVTRDLGGDALVASLTAESLPSDGLLAVPTSLDLSLDALVQQSGLCSSAGTALVQETNVSSLSANADLVATETSDLGASGYLVATGTNTSELAVDSVVEVAQVIAALADALVALSTTTSFSADADLQATSTIALTSDGPLQASALKSLDANAITQQSVNLDLLATGAVESSFTLASSADALIQTTHQLETTASADLVATEISEVSVSAIMQVSTELSATADADLFATELSEVASSGYLIVFGQNVAELSGDGVVLVTQTSEATSDAQVAITTATDLSASADLIAAETSELQGGALVQQAQVVDFDLDAVIQATLVCELTSDAALLETIAASASADAILLATQTISLVNDGVVQAPGTTTLFGEGLIFVGDLALTLEASADLLVTQVQESTADGYLVSQGTNVREFSGGAITIATETTEINADGQVARAMANDLPSSAILEQSVALDLGADADLRAAEASLITGDGYLIATGTNVGELSSTGVVIATGALGLSGDSQVALTRTTQTSSDALLQITNTVSANVDAVLLGTKAADLGASALVQQAGTADLPVTGTVQSIFTITFTGDAALQATQAQNLSASGDLRATETLECTSSALLAQDLTRDLMGDAVIFATNTPALTSDAYLIIPQSLSLSASSLLQGTSTLAVTADSYLALPSTDECQADAFIIVITSCDVSSDAVVNATEALTCSGDGLIQGRHGLMRRWLRVLDPLLLRSRVVGEVEATLQVKSPVSATPRVLGRRLR